MGTSGSIIIQRDRMDYIRGWFPRAFKDAIKQSLFVLRKLFLPVGADGPMTRQYKNGWKKSKCHLTGWLIRVQGIINLDEHTGSTWWVRLNLQPYQLKGNSAYRTDSAYIYDSDALEYYIKFSPIKYSPAIQSFVKILCHVLLLLVIWLVVNR